MVALFCLGSDRCNSYDSLVTLVSILQTDIDECADGFNGGCEDRCENRIHRIDNVTHQCFCDAESQSLASNNFSCQGEGLVY